MTDLNEKIDIADILKASTADNSIPCSKVFEICNKYSFFPDLAGFTMDQYNLRITFCQLGLFGYPEGKKIPVCDNISKTLEDRILSSLEDKKLPCSAAWNIASDMNIRKMDVSSACEKLGIKIGRCQLGAFSPDKKNKCS